MKTSGQVHDRSLANPRPVPLIELKTKGTTANKKEEWQDPDSGYLNCIGAGDTYVKKQIARILSQNKITADSIIWFTHDNGIEARTNNVEFNKKEL